MKARRRRAMSQAQSTPTVPWVVVARWSTSPAKLVYKMRLALIASSFIQSRLSNGHTNSDVGVESRYWGTASNPMFTDARFFIRCSVSRFVWLSASLRESLAGIVIVNGIKNRGSNAKTARGPALQASSAEAAWKAKKEPRDQPPVTAFSKFPFESSIGSNTADTKCLNDTKL